MNICRLFILAVACLLLPNAQAELIGYDGFDYRGSNMNGAQGGAFWGHRNISPNGHLAGMSDWDDAPGFGGTSVSSGGMLFTADGGVIREYAGPTDTDEGNGAINDVTVARKVYYRITMTRGADATWCGVSSFDFANERLFFGLFPDGTGKFSIYNQNTFTRMALSTVNVTVGQTYTLVAKVDYATDTVALYVDPNLTLSEASNTPIATATFTATNWSTAIRVGSGGTGLVSWDDLSVATTWESLRTYEVTNLNDSGTGSLRVLMSLARTTGGRVKFAPELRAVYAVSETNRLLRFRRETPGTIELDVPVTGLQPEEFIVGLDFRPSTGELFALGKISSSKGPGPAPAVRLYKLNVTTGAATLVGSGPFSSTLGDTGAMGFDFDPVTDMIRITNESRDNVLVSPANASIIAVQTSLTYAGASSGTPRITQTAYGKNVSGSTNSTLYGFDNQNSRLAIIGGMNGNPSAATGKVTLLSAGTGEEPMAFDIGDDGTALVNALPSGALVNRNSLYEVDLNTGNLKLIGTIGNGSFYVYGLAMAPSRITLTSGPLTFTGGNAFVVDGPSIAPGITLAGRKAQQILTADSGASIALRNLNITDGSYNQGGAISYGPSATDPVGLLSLERCALFENFASTRGGAIAIDHGHLRMTQCCVSHNSSGSGGASAIYQGDGNPVNLWGKIILNQCTFTQNHTTSASLSSPAQALALPAAMVEMNGTVVAGNTNGGGTGGTPDLKVTGNITAPAVVTYCVVGDGTSTGLTNGVNGNRIGSTSTPVLPGLAALGNYGGPTQSRPPLPGSVALNFVIGSTVKSDQRGFLINGVADAGAADFQGAADLKRCWNTDWDSDGVRFGVEFATGRDPNVATGDSPLNLVPHPHSLTEPGTHALVFNVGSLARQYGVKWVISSSFALSDFFSAVGWVSYDYTPPSTYSVNPSALFGFNWVIPSASSPTVRLKLTPNLSKAFFRLEAELP